MNHAHLFTFESDFVATLRCVPMAVRYKLDQVGIKLSLRQWSRLGPDQRHRLLLMPCATTQEAKTYRQVLCALVAEHTDEPVKVLGSDGVVPWQASGQTPDIINQFAASAGAAPVNDQAWRNMADLQRFALLKLSRDNHDNVNFLPALKEFGLYASAPPDTAADRQ